MRAKFPGRCTRTGTRIRVGDDIVADGHGGWMLPADDPRLQPVPTPEQTRRERIRFALTRRPDLTNQQP